MAIKLKQGGDEVLSEINITPFTDVLLVLLIIFMIAATAVVQNGFNINLPKKATPVAQTDDSDIVVSIAVPDKVTVSGTSGQVGEDELLPLLKRMKENKMTDKVIIVAEGDVQYAEVIKVMDVAKQANLTSIALARDESSARTH